MIIRPATICDLPDLIPLFETYNGESLVELKYSKEAAVHTLVKMFDGRSLVLVMEIDDKVVGAIAGVIVNSLLSVDVFFQEVFCYILEEYRGKRSILLRSCENYCKGKFVTKMILCHPGEERAEASHRYFKGEGYKILDTHYIKSI